MQIDAFGLSDVGRQRQHNEDTFLIQQDAKLFLVADGMGGHAAGEIASKIAVDSVREFIQQTEEEEGTWPHGYDDHLSRTTNRLVAALRIANGRVIEAMKQDARLRGMGTTIVASLLDGEMLSLAHVGDSRAYLIRNGEMARVTNDHSWVYEQVQAGMISEEEAERHPFRNVITRALGGAATVMPDAREVDLRAGDAVLLCSDGLTGMVPETEILRIVVEAPDAATACRRLIDTANQRGGNDNITAVLVRIAGD